ncbi:hypothetical protein BH09BAC6_BH09BAC6_33980 [soil metagenome]|jgi:hypothetical protein
MIANNDDLADDRDIHPRSVNSGKAGGYQVDDDGVEEKDLERTFLFGDGGEENTQKPVREGEPMGGQAFGKNNNTPAGDDKNNPSQNAGYSNAYFARTEPSEEHPENSNFTAPKQDGQPDYSKAESKRPVTDEMPKPEKVERGNGENDRPHPQEPFREGTADIDEPNIPGPGEVPDQQKVGEELDDPGERDHIET